MLSITWNKYCLSGMLIQSVNPVGDNPFIRKGPHQSMVICKVVVCQEWAVWQNTAREPAHLNHRILSGPGHGAEGLTAALNLIEDCGVVDEKCCRERSRKRSRGANMKTVFFFQTFQLEASRRVSDLIYRYKFVIFIESTIRIASVIL